MGEGEGEGEGEVLSTVAAPRAMSACVAMLVLSTRRRPGFCVKMAGLM